MGEPPAVQLILELDTYRSCYLPVYGEKCSTFNERIVIKKAEACFYENLGPTRHLLF